MNGPGCDCNCVFTTGSTDLNSPGFDILVGTEIMPEDPLKDVLSCGGVFGRSLKCISRCFGGDSMISGV